MRVAGAAPFLLICPHAGVRTNRSPGCGETTTGADKIRSGPGGFISAIFQDFVVASSLQVSKVVEVPVERVVIKEVPVPIQVHVQVRQVWFPDSESP